MDLREALMCGKQVEQDLGIPMLVTIGYSAFVEIEKAARETLARREQEPKKVTIGEMVEWLEKAVGCGHNPARPGCEDCVAERVWDAAAALLSRVGEFKKAWADKDYCVYEREKAGDEFVAEIP